jgi:quinol monooxygenase YgiN
MQNRMRRNAMALVVLPLGLALLVAAAVFSARAQSQTAPKDERVYIVTHVDSVPTGVATAVKLLQQYAADTRKDPGVERVEVLVQASRPNHYTIVELWRNMQAYEAHVGAAHTRKFREDMLPFLGAPFDERPHTLLE